MNNKFNKISMKYNIIILILVSFIAILCVLPYILAIGVSFTSEEYIRQYGFSLFPQDFSLDAYKIIFTDISRISSAYFITIIVTVLGTIFALFVTLTLGYVISRKDFKYRNSLTFFIFFTMLFNAGMTANYMVMTNVLHLYDTIWALILPMVVNPFWIFMARTFFIMSIPDEIIESSRIDGANEFTILRRIVLPVSLPISATIGLFSVLGYWNDWFNAKLYIENESLVSLQFFLVRIQESTKFLIENASKMGGAGVSLSQLPEDSMMMAIMVIATIPLVVAYPFFQRYFVTGLTIGAVK
ncbi:MAG: carbohydrate ABC transporter permease [Mycoplasmatales bacterium]